MSTTCAFAGAGGTPHHFTNLSTAVFAVRSNVSAAWFWSQRSCWFVPLRTVAGQVCAALLAEGFITPTSAHTLWSRFATAQGAWSDA